jgi:hypothetical protein
MFYKIIKDRKVIDIGSVLLRWQKKNKTLLPCPKNCAHYLKTDSDKIYETTWLRKIHLE